MILGAVIAYQRPVLLAIPAALVVIQVTRAHREARVLEAAFGDAYREYRKRTWF
jgi:protein-S-isoprenylcysteine O-methyltransferase Ste14